SGGIRQKFGADHIDEGAGGQGDLPPAHKVALPAARGFAIASIQKIETSNWRKSWPRRARSLLETGR
ncbi:MAG: hypothetical protein KDJ40_08835, partial [Hyphomicrobiales bacterium]|nr:hypothetical protein [Hyphomicrobiales bacterium]